MFPVKSHGAVVVIVPNAPLKAEQGVELKETVHYFVTDGLPMVVVDCRDVPLMDSAGLESLLDLHEDIESRGGSIRLAALPQLCQDILRVTGIDRTLAVYEDEKSAVRSFLP